MVIKAGNELVIEGNSYVSVPTVRSEWDSLKYALDKNLDTRAEIEEMIEYSVITAIGNQLMYGDEIIGENINEAIVYMNNKKNSGQVTAMKAQLKELKV